MQKRCLSLGVEGTGCCGRRWETAAGGIQTVFSVGEGRGRHRKACAEKDGRYRAKLWRQLGPCPRLGRAAPSLQSWMSARAESPAAPSSASTMWAATSVPAKRGSSRTPTAAPATVSPSVPVARSNWAQQREEETLSKLIPGLCGHFPNKRIGERVPALLIRCYKCVIATL